MKTVSVVMPAYNAEAYLAEAIDSVLNQSYKDTEVIVVNDGSTDRTAAVAAGYGDKINYIHQENAGVSVARNRGILAARGEFISFLDADDVLCADMLSRLVPEFDRHSDAGVVYCGHTVVNLDRVVLGRSPVDLPSGNVFYDLFVRGCLCAVHAAVVKREVFVTSGLFDPRLRQQEDYELWIRIARDWQFVYVPEHLAIYRQLAGSNGRQYGEYDCSRRVLLAITQSWLVNGSIRRAHWKSMVRMTGRYRVEKLAQDAFVAYSAGRFGEAARLARGALLRSPRFLLNRGLWSVAVRSQFQNWRRNSSGERGA